MLRKLYRTALASISRFLIKISPTSPFLKFHSFIPVHYKNIISYEPDVIYAHDLSALPLGFQVSKELGAKLVFDSHELETHRNPPLTSNHKKQVIRTEKKYLPKCDYVTTVCESIRLILEDEYNLKNTGLLFNSPRLVPALHNPRWKGEFRRPPLKVEAGLKSNDFALVYVGLITFNRGIEFALRAMAHTDERIKLVAIGPAGPGMQGKMMKFAKSIGMEDRLIMLDPVPPPHVYQYLQGADASIIPVLPITLSYEVAMPNKFFEASFAGLPLICADLFEMKKYVTKYNLGELYDAIDELDCTRAINSVFYKTSKNLPSQADIERFKADFSWERQENTMLQILSKITTREIQ